MGAGTEQDRKLWLAKRRQGLGGSDVAAILGLSRFKSPYAVWLEKTSELPEEKDTPQKAWGRRLEAVIAEHYEHMTGRVLYSIPPDEVLHHSKYPFLLGTPDRLVRGEALGVEIKSVNGFAAGDWGPEGTEEVPIEAALQCLHYMAVTEFPRWDAVPLIGSSDWRVYRMHRDLALEAEVIGACVSWWEEHVVGKTPPPVDGSRSTSSALARRFPTSSVELLKADAETTSALVALHSARARLDKAEEEVRLLENQVKAFIGDAVGVEADEFRATWKGSARRTTDWHAIADVALETLARSWNAANRDGVDFARWQQNLLDSHVEEQVVRRFLFKGGVK